jgi:hypothetical protein
VRLLAGPLGVLGLLSDQRDAAVASLGDTDSLLYHHISILSYLIVSSLLQKVFCVHITWVGSYMFISAYLVIDESSML